MRTPFWLLFIAATLVGIVWALAWNPRETHTTDWKTAASRMERRLGIGEILVLFPHQRAVQTRPLAGLPCVCEGRRGDDRPKVEKLGAGGLWVVGQDRIPGHLAKALKKMDSLGSIRFGDVFLWHGWNPKSSLKRLEEPRK